MRGAHLALAVNNPKTTLLTATVKFFHRYKQSNRHQTFRMSRIATGWSHAAGSPEHAPEGVLAVVCLDNPRDNTRSKVR